MDLIGRLRREDPPPPQPIDPDALREEMAQDDPSFGHVRDVHHDALGLVGALSVADGISIRREREWWERHGQPPTPKDHPNGGQKPC